MSTRWLALTLAVMLAAYALVRFTAIDAVVAVGAAVILLGVSALSVYKWESGNTRPRAKQIQAIAALRKMGRREAAERLGES